MRPGGVEVDFAYGVPDLSSAPIRDWMWALREAGRTAPTSVMGDENGGGDLRLREVVATDHRRVRAGTAEVEHAVIVNGFRQGLALALGALARSGVERVGLEDPGPREHDELVRGAGMQPVAVPVDGDGLDVEALRRSGARAVVVTPAHQCPTGVVMGPERRHALIACAAEVDGTILEDDYDAEFRYDRQPVGSLQGLAPDRVLALGSLSKTLAPGSASAGCWRRQPWSVRWSGETPDQPRSSRPRPAGAGRVDGVGALRQARAADEGGLPPTPRHPHQGRDRARSRRAAGRPRGRVPRGPRTAGARERRCSRAFGPVPRRPGLRDVALPRRCPTGQPGQRACGPVLGFGNLNEERILRGGEELGKIISDTPT